MLRRKLFTLGERLSGGDNSSHQDTAPREEICDGRRGFFAKAAVGAVAVTGTAGLAKVVVDTVPVPDLQDLYRKDHLAGEQELKQREYVLMTDREKKDMVQSMVDRYHDQG